MIKANLSSPHSILLENLTTSLRSSIWFHAVGHTLDPNTQQKIDRYLDSVDRTHLKIILIKKWNAVRPVARSLDWDRDIVSDQIQERENLKLHSDKNHGAKNCASLIQECITNITQSADQALTLAHRAQPDISLAKAASGALADAAFDAILSTLAMDDRQTPAKSKFELFQIGRWPLSMTKEVFFIF